MAFPVSVSATTDDREATDDEIRKRRRKESNRMSARRSRARRQLQVDGLTEEAAALQACNAAMAAAAREAVTRRAGVEAENRILRTRAVELGARLEALVGMIQCVEETAVAGYANPFLVGVNGVLPSPPQPVLDAAMYQNCYHY